MSDVDVPWGEETSDLHIVPQTCFFTACTLVSDSVPISFERFVAPLCADDVEQTRRSHEAPPKRRCQAPPSLLAQFPWLQDYAPGGASARGGRAGPSYSAVAPVADSAGKAAAESVLDADGDDEWGKAMAELADARAAWAAEDAAADRFVVLIRGGKWTMRA